MVSNQRVEDRKYPGVKANLLHFSSLHLARDQEAGLKDSG